jgi:hypothetical protein
VIDYQTLKLLHQHGNDWAEMHPRAPHSAAELDPERDWATEGVVYVCQCGDAFSVAPSREPEPTLHSRKE